MHADWGVRRRRQRPGRTQIPQIPAEIRADGMGWTPLYSQRRPFRAFRLRRSRAGAAPPGRRTVFDHKDTKAGGFGSKLPEKRERRG
jgi:hypothetical protein